MKLLAILLVCLTGHNCFADRRIDWKSIAGRIEIDDIGQALAVTIFVWNGTTNPIEIVTGSTWDRLGAVRPVFITEPGRIEAIRPSIITRPDPEYPPPAITNVLKPNVEWKIGAFVILKPTGWGGLVTRVAPALPLFATDSNLEYRVAFTGPWVAEPGGAASQSQPIRSQTNGTPPAAGSGR